MNNENKISIPELLYRSHKAGEITKEDYYTRTAIWVAENTNEYRGQKFVPLEPWLRQYYIDRVTNKIPKDKAFNEELSFWCKLNRSSKELATGDLTLLEWALSKIIGAGLIKQQEPLNRAITWLKNEMASMRDLLGVEKYLEKEWSASHGKAYHGDSWDNDYQGMVLSKIRPDIGTPMSRA